MSKKVSWRQSSSSLKKIIFTCLIIFSLGYTVECQEEPERPKAFAAPTGLNALDVDGSDKAFFKIGPTRDGITRAIADEVSPSVHLQFPPNSPNDSPAYDDNLVEPTGEEELFIPSIYRNDTDKEKEEKKTTTTTRAPTTTRRVTFGRETLPPVVNTPRPPQPLPPVQLPPAVQVPRQPVQTQTRFPQPPPTTRPPPPPPPQTRPPPPPVVQQTRPPPPPPVFQTRPPPPQTRPPPPPQVFQTRPPPPQAPVFQTRPPPQTLPPPPPTRQPFQQPQPQPLPAFRPQQPQRPLQPQTLPAFQQPAPQSFIPQLRPVQQTRPPPPPPAPTTPRPFFTQPPPPPQLQPFQQQPFRPRPRPQPLPQQQPQQAQPTPPPRPLRPFRPAGNRPFRPRQRPEDPTGLRTGFCPFTIFYQSGPAAAFEASQTYTHFASVVSVDQCARTCHEFKCDFAFFDSANRHCQFNPGQGAAAPPPTCPTYPSPFLRNNVPLSAVPLRISCITCQRRRRINRVNGRIFTNRFGQTRRQFNPQVIGRSIANVVHGVLIKQPQSVAIGFGPSIPRQDSFRSTELESLTESLTEEEKRENAAKAEESAKEQEETSAENKGQENVEEEQENNEQVKEAEKPKINADMILMNMHKLSSAEASDESKEIISSLESNLSVIDSDTEAGDDGHAVKASKLPLPISSETETESVPPKKHLLQKPAGLIKKSTTNLQRIAAADKPIESSEDSSISFA